MLFIIQAMRLERKLKAYKVLFPRVIVNRLIPQAEEITAEEKAEFRTGRSSDFQPKNPVRKVSST